MPLADSTDVTARLEARLQRLERDHQRLRWVNVGLGALVVGMVCGAGTIGPGDVVATKFKLVDGQGRTRGIWKVLDDSPYLALTDSAGKAVVLVNGDRQNAGVDVSNPAGDPVASLGLSDGMAQIALRGADGKKAISLATNADEAFVRVADGGPNSSVFMSSGKDGNTVSVDHATGRAALFNRGHGASWVLADRDGKAAVTAAGPLHAVMVRRVGVGMAAMVASEAGPVVMAVDKDFNVKWHAPADVPLPSGPILTGRLP